VFALALVILAVLTVVVFLAMRSAVGWEGVIRGTAVYTIAVVAMALVTVLVILATHAAAR